ncbi:5-formyltetrahydrofolate cyclo-ligase [Butyrivibrio sp. JL13D10]|uniref:5-formyltetrahydrofolate cyclo-ligase n=1 Tax=Butyrivibrio sp. JL13D10 TaxID=3236815 RepID=UPI0038B628AD
MIRLNSIKLINGGYEKYPDNEFEKKEYIKKKLAKKASKLLKISLSDIDKVIIRKHSIDARKKSEIMDVFVIDVKISEKSVSEEKILRKSGCKQASIVSEKKYHFPYNRKEDEEFKRKTDSAMRPIVIGAGPAGLFCAYELAMAGYCPIVLERGMDVDKRHDAVEAFWNGGKLMPEGNVQFGEGGAGTFSDGKLNTMIKDKNGLGLQCLKIFHEYGAPEDILYESKPHIGTDILRKVIKNIRNEIIRKGGTFFFETKVTQLLITDSKINGVKCQDGKEFKSDVVVLAIGHSARDTFYALKDQGISMQPKAFAIGLRVEHEQSLINKSQYGIEDPASLPPSPYKVTARSRDGRGVYSFCMCPGGYVVNASSEEGRLCVNGMSYSGRDGKNANSAIVVTIEPDDFGSEDVLAGVEFQRKLESKAFELAGGNVPVEYFDDFKKGVEIIYERNQGKDVLQKEDELQKNMEKHKNVGRNNPCIKGRWSFAPVHEILPCDINRSIVEGFAHFGKMIEGFDKDDALLSGIESRTSSPVRINRDENFEALGIEGLYPSGEGAGYAGGITSAAMDGMKVAEKIAMHYKNGKDFYRDKMTKMRNLLSEDDKKALDDNITEKLLSSKEYREAENVLAYNSFRSEADTTEVIKNALNNNKKVFCPKITDTKTRKMEFVQINSLSELVEGKYSIPEPVLKSDSVKFSHGSEKTVIILPGLVFDKSGNRIGYGGGYYDNYLKELEDKIKDYTVTTIAIGYDFQNVSDDLSPFMTEDDHKVKIVITDKETYRHE